MFSRNYTPDKGYFVMRRDEGKFFTLSTYALDQDVLTDIAPELGCFSVVHTTENDIDYFLTQNKAVMTDYYNTNSRTVCPAQARLETETGTLRKLCFRNAEGKQNAPMDHFPAIIDLREDWIEMMFRQNGREQATDIRKQIHTSALKNEFYARVFTQETEPENYPALQKAYANCFAFLKNPNASIALPRLYTHYAVSILTPGS